MIKTAIQVTLKDRKYFVPRELVGREEEIAVLNNRGIASKNIAKIMKLDIGFVREWRKLNGFTGSQPKVHCAKCGRVQSRAFDRNEAKELYTEGFSDSFIAAELRTSTYQIRMWREENSLSANSFMIRRKAVERLEIEGKNEEEAILRDKESLLHTKIINEMMP
jgi:hypothetical protein